ncbi:MAG: hypothetical protein CMM87_03730 [Rickettsiales bacterium]|nr:hypothetical protein [Rickettsiales bacterium]
MVEGLRSVSIFFVREFGKLKKAFAKALRSAAVQQIGRAIATDIGEARTGGGLGYMPHKLLHSITGAHLISL